MSDKITRYMIFLLSGQRYAIPVDAVAEIADMLPAYQIPFAPRFMRGIVNIHGKLAPVLDLALFSGTGAATNGGNLLLLNRPETSLALVVERMERIITSEEIISREEGKNSLEQARLILADGPVTELAVDALLARIEEVLER